MWQPQQPQQQQRNSFRLDNRFRECEAAALISRADSATKLVSLAATGLESSDWQRAAALVQSPLSANSEGSSTSTPDQCPPSPAPTFCEMPSSRNGSCNKQIRQKEMHQQHQQIAWNNLPSRSPAPPKSGSLLEVECGKWSTQADNLFDDQAHDPYGSTPILNSSQGYALDAPLISRTAELMSRSCSEDTERSLQNPVVSTPGSRGLSSMYQVEMQVPAQVIKQEEEFLLGGRNGLVIDDKVLALQRSATTSSSKIGNFMDLLRQADRPIPDATAAASASCSHLGQLLSGSQDTPEMWLTRSSRLPAMLSEVLPSNSAGKSTESYERNKRKTADMDTRDRGSTVQLQEAVIPKQHQDEDEPATNDRVPIVGGFASSSGGGEPELFSKRPKIENSNSFPFKMQVRKEKLGERISALQQLVSPFGKTDTASVLLEAIGYIKFLHEQVQVLSSPYMKPTGGSTTRHNEHGKICEERQDLRSRGLCLVPVSCTLQVANDNGADYWAPTLHGLK